MARTESIFSGAGLLGEASEFSDVDLGVIKPTLAPFFDRLREAARPLSSEWGSDILVYRPEEFTDEASGNAFAQMVETEGVIVYDQTQV